jgi:glycosyltransferase involved in cell wall biosynthesis
MAKVDVLMPVRNAMPYLEESISSIRNQTFTDWKLHILDHGSNDGSFELATRHASADRRIVADSFPDIVGLSELRNAGLARCDCSLVVCQDADDISLPHRITSLLEAISENDDLLAVGSEAYTIDAAGMPLGRLSYPEGEQNLAAAALFYNPVAQPAIAFKLRTHEGKDIRYGIDLLNWAPNDGLTQFSDLVEDYFLFAQLSLLGKCKNLRKLLLKYRVHSSGVSRMHRKQQMQSSLGVSRFLARSIASRLGIDDFDPAPFCAHGENVFRRRGTNYADLYRRIQLALISLLGENHAVRRELAIREVLAASGEFSAMLKILKLAAKYNLDPHEKRQLRNFALQRVRPKFVEDLSELQY